MKKMEVIENPSRENWQELVARPSFDESDIAVWVGVIIDRVRTCGDEAIRKLTAEIDKVTLADFEVTDKEIAEAVAKVSPEIKAAIETAKNNIEKFHKAQVAPEADVETMPGVRCVQRAVPVQRVGFYIPGGSAPLFSTVLMLAVPAQIAGCPETILCTPPDKNGTVAPEILYTASVCGIKRIFKIGGAQAIAAMAYGTESIPRVEKIFGPGNRYVMKAKQLVSLSQCGIDMPAGPSEVMVMADSTANAEFVASDLLSQAEHGGDSQCMLVTDSREFADEVTAALERQTALLPRQEIVKKALSASRVVVFNNVEDMVAFANEYAAEHLIISMKDAWGIAAKITAAGSIFIGNYSPESAGDYASGTNHTLPTSGWARSFSGVNIDSFTRKITIQELSREGLEGLAPVITTMAEAEGLDAHAQAVRIRLNTKE